MKAKAEFYRNMLVTYLMGGYESSGKFACNYDRTFLSDSIGDKRLYEILSEFFFEVQAYYEDWEPEDIDEYHITEEMLVSKAKIALEKIDKYLNYEGILAEPEVKRKETLMRLLGRKIEYWLEEWFGEPSGE